jgi:hypothetical protein
MQHTLTVEIPDEIYEPLLRRAQQTGKTPEAVVLEWLTSTAQHWTEDPLLQLAGCFASDVTDVSDQHDTYIGQSLFEELPRDNHA